jgi:hypothetical protein
VARDHLARAVCGVGFLANIQIFAAKTTLQPIPIQAPRIHANKSALPESAIDNAASRRAGYLCWKTPMRQDERLMNN